MQTLLLHTRNSVLSRYSAWWSRWSPLLRAVALAIAVGVAYFLVARLSLALLTKPDGVAVFWPAAGIASGTLIALGSAARLPVVLGVVTATIAANLLGDRNLAAGLVFALCNAGETLLVAWLIARYFGEAFRLESLRSVLGFFVAASVGPAISGIAATVGFVQFHSSDATVLTTWQNWFVSDALGIIMVAPLLVGLGGLRDDLPQRWELCEGIVTLAALGIVTAIAFGTPAQYWYTVLPLGLLLPVLLAAHCRPVFAAAAALVLGFAVVWTTTFTIDDLGELPSLHDRAFAGRATLLAIATCTLILAALFAERRQKEKALEDSNDRLKDSNGRLQLALDCAELGTWSLDLESGRFENDVRDRRINGHDLDGPPLTFAQVRSQIHPDDLSSLDAAFAGLGRAGGSCRTEYRLAPRTDQEGTDRERWVAIEGAVVRDASGQPAQLLGVTRDITERKRAVDRLQESERKLRDLLGALPAAIYVTDAAGHITYCNQSAVDLWGTEPVLGKDKWSDLVKFYHADGSLMALADCPTEVALKQGRIVRGQEAIIERKDGTRIPIIPYPTPLRDKTGTIVGVVNMTVDISERKKAELILADQTTQLALAGKAALVGNFAYDADSEWMRISEGYAAIHGFPDGTTEIARSEWQLGLHPEDRVGLEEIRSRCFRERLAEYSVDYRIVRSEGEIRWIDARCFVSYHGNGRPKRVVGVNIDITERKRAEEHLQAVNAELDHRVKNVLATASAVATQTLNASRSSEQFVSAFDGRLRSMAQTHELLSERLWRGVPLAELLRRELAPYAIGNNTEIGGPEVILSAEAGQTLAMVFHELATNAAKHGAFSSREGRVSVDWRRQLNGNAGAGLVIEWRETGGPPTKAEGKAGYGMSVICELIPHELAGKVDHVLTPAGARCQLKLPDRWIDASSPS